MGDSEVRPWRSRRGADVQVVEGERCFPVVEREVLVTGAGERFGIGPRQKRTAIDGPIEGTALAGDREVIRAIWLDADVAAASLSTGAVLVLAADDGQRVA